MGAEGTSGSVWVRLRAALPRLAGLSEFPRWRAPGLSEQKAKPEAGAETRRVASCQGTGRSGVSSAQGAGPALRAPGRSRALPDRPPLPLQAGEVRGARSAPSAPSRPLRQLREPGARAELSLPSRAERRSCPKSRRRSAPPLGSCCSGARCRVSGGAAARAARTWAPAPGPGQARGGAEAPGRVRSAPPPGSPAPSAAEGPDGDMPEEGGAGD